MNVKGPVRKIGIRGGKIEEVDPLDVDLELGSPNKFFGSHINLIPMPSAVAGPRSFYGARFYNQAMPIVGAEAPLVQNLIDDDPDGRSFDDQLGRHAGAVFSDDDAEVLDVTPDDISLRLADGSTRKLDIYNNFPLNRKTSLSNIPLVKPGDKIRKGQILARSNYTDDKGTLAMGLNARIGLTPYLGKSMDDAVVISEDFANRLRSEHMYGHDIEYKRGVKGGKGHYVGIFPDAFDSKQLEALDSDGVIKPGTRVEEGDPLILATRPKVISSLTANLGNLSKHMRNARSDAVVKWEHHTPGIVTDVVKLKNGVKLNVMSEMPAQTGDKITLRSGQKGIISDIIPQNHMPRTEDGRPLDVLLNPQGIPSRVNDSLIYEILLGKAARKRGKPYRIPAFNKPDEKWYEIVQRELADNGLSDTEVVFDPKFNRKLERPILVGDAYVQKLHHTSESKTSTRSTGAYTMDQQPLKGGDEAAQAKRLSGLTTASLMSSGAYNYLREGATLRGQRNDEYWRDLRMGHTPREPGEPFVWGKFKALLAGSGYLARKLGGGKERLQFWTDRDLDRLRPVKIRNGELVDLTTMKPIPGGLFDEGMAGTNSWGYVDLPFPVPNPAAEDVIRKLLGLTQKQFRDIMAGREELPEHLQSKMKSHAS